MDKTLKVLVVSEFSTSAKYYAGWINGGNIEDCYKIEDADIIVFRGGEDIHPNLYKEYAIHKNTHPNSERDRFEIQVWKAARTHDKFMVGICRGAQLMCALSGGRLVQDISGHYSPHNIILTETGETVCVNSIHHQLMMPYEMPMDEYEILGAKVIENEVLQDGLQNNYSFKKYIGDTKTHVYRYPSGIKDFLLPEIVYFKKTKCFAIQSHPEMMNSGVGNNPTPLYKPALEAMNNMIIERFNEHMEAKVANKINAYADLWDSVDYRTYQD